MNTDVSALYFNSNHCLDALEVVEAINRRGAHQGRGPPQTTILEEATARYEEAKSAAEENPHNVELQVKCVMEWAWLHQAQQAAGPARVQVRLPAGFTRAATGGQQVVQEWLTKGEMCQQPTLQVTNKEKAKELMDFRLQVSRLDTASSTHQDHWAT